MILLGKLEHVDDAKIPGGRRNGENNAKIGIGFLFPLN